MRSRGDLRGFAKVYCVTHSHTERVCARITSKSLDLWRRGSHFLVFLLSPPHLTHRLHCIISRAKTLYFVVLSYARWMLWPFCIISISITDFECVLSPQKVNIYRGDVSKSTSNLMILLSPIISCTSEWLYRAVLLLLCGVVYCLRCDACFRLIVLDTDVVRRRHFAVWAAATSPIPLYLPQSFCFFVCDSLPPKFAPEAYDLRPLFIFCR